MAALEISLLGGFLLRRDGEPPQTIASRAARSLFAYLVLSRDRVLTRDLVAGTFWPDLPDATARRRLSQALWQIQSALGTDPAGQYIVSTSVGLRLNPDADMWLDVDEFEWTLDHADEPGQPGATIEALDTGTALYRGDLLAGFYDDWMIPDRERLRERFLSALTRLSDLLTGRGDYEAALVHARRLAQHDPLREEAHRKVMRLTVLLGRHNEAIRQFETCRRILAEELDAEPSPETLDLYWATLHDRDADRPAPVVDDEPPLFDADIAASLVGRERERTLMVELLDGALDGRGGVVLVEGEAGVGKTRLLSEAAGDARWRGMEVLWGRTSPSGGRPYEPFATAMGGLSTLRRRQLAQHLDAVWRELLVPFIPLPAEGPGHAPVAPMPRADEQARMLEAFAVALTEAGRFVPLLVVLEDVHWADDDTIQAISRVTGRVRSSRVLIAISYRHGEAREHPEVWDLLRSIDRFPYCERVSLAPCTPAQTEELIRRCLGVVEVNGEFSEQVHRETGGNPLFIIESLRALHEEGKLGHAGGLAVRPWLRHASLPLTPAMHERILSRLDGLTDPSHLTLNTIAVHHGELELGEIVAASQLDDHATLDAVDELVRRRLLTEDGGSYSVSHELLRRVVLESLTPSVRMDLHRRVALAVEPHRPDAAETLAHHFTEAHMPDRAAPHHERAAERAVEVHAYDAAAHHLAATSEALDAIEAPADHRYRIAAFHEEILDTLARRSEQEQVLHRLRRFAAPEDRAEVARRLAWWLAHQDRFAEAEVEAKRSLALARELGDEGRRVAALSALGLMACYAGRAAEGVEYLEEVALLEAGDPRRQADARNALGQNLIDLQRFDEAEQHLLAASTLYGELGYARGQAEVLGMLGTLRMERGEPDSAEADFRRAIDISRAIGYRHGEAVYEMNLGILRALDNRFTQAISSWDTSAAVYETMGNGRGRALVLSNSAWMRHAILGDDERADRDATDALSTYKEIGDVRGQAQCLATLASVAARRGTTRRSWPLLAESLALATQAEDLWLSAQILRAYATAELESGSLDSGIAHAQEAIEICDSAGMHDLRISILPVLARLLLAVGHSRQALQLTSEAMRHLRPGIEMSHLIPLVHATALLETGSIGEANSHFDLAHRGLMQLVSGLDREQRDRALSNVPGHREIVERWLERRPQTVNVRIASSEAPSGRALEDHELVTVTWTPWEPSDQTIKDARAQRRHRLIRLLTEAAEQGGAPTIADLAGALGVGAATVRRDLSALRAEGRHVATRGTRIAPPS